MRKLYLNRFGLKHQKKIFFKNDHECLVWRKPSSEPWTSLEITMGVVSKAVGSETGCKPVQHRGDMRYRWTYLSTRWKSYSFSCVSLWRCDWVAAVAPPCVCASSSSRAWPLWWAGAPEWRRRRAAWREVPFTPECHHKKRFHLVTTRGRAFGVFQKAGLWFCYCIMEARSVYGKRLSLNSLKI